MTTTVVPFDVPCRSCGQPAGAACVTRTGKLAAAHHRPRWADSDELPGDVFATPSLGRDGWTFHRMGPEDESADVYLVTLDGTTVWGTVSRRPTP
jgi:hypothetical protein